MDLKTITSGIVDAAKKVPNYVYVAGALVIGTLMWQDNARAGYSNMRGEHNPEYHFNGYINGQRTKFSETFFRRHNILETRSNGDKIKRYDFDEDFLPDRIDVTTRRGTTSYSYDSNNPKAIAVLEKDRREGNFERILDEIMAIQTAPLNR